MKMKLGGWHRLYMVVGCIYLLVVAAIVIISYPSPENTFHSDEFYKNLPPIVRDKIITEKRLKAGEYPKDSIITVKFPNGHIFYLSKKLSTKEQNEIGKAYWSVIEEQCDKNRWQMIFQAGLLWSLPMMGLYILGWSVGWIYKGFKQN